MITTKYIVKLTEDVTPEMEENSRGTKLSLDVTKTILKFDGETPEVFSGEVLLTHDEIIEVISGPEWQE